MGEVERYMPQAVTRREFDKLKAEVEHLKENVALLSSPELLEKIRAAQRRIAAGKGVSLEQATRGILGKEDL